GMSVVIPAIDLRGGRCVRLVQGRADAETVYADDPVAVARSFAEAGARRLHVVDLDGAFEGLPRNLDVVTAIVQAVDIPVQLGGGIRDMAAVDEVLRRGVQWVILRSEHTSELQSRENLVCRLLLEKKKIYKY